MLATSTSAGWAKEEDGPQASHCTTGCYASTQKWGRKRGGGGGMKSLASMAAECVELVNLDMAAVQWRTVRSRCVARWYWCQMLQRERENPATWNMFQWKDSVCLELLENKVMIFNYFVRENLAVAPGNEIASPHKLKRGSAFLWSSLIMINGQKKCCPGKFGHWRGKVNARNCSI